MTATAPTKSKPNRASVAASASPLRGRVVRVMTNDQLIADIKAHGREIRKTKESAIAFLQRAGIVDNKGELAEPYRAG
jgi:hypothetical protein